MVVKPLFFTFKGAEECSYPIPRQLPALTFPQHLGRTAGHEAHCGSTALPGFCQPTAHCGWKDPYCTFHLSTPNHLLVPAPASTQPPGQTVQQPSRLKINQKEKNRKRGGEDCTKTNQPPVPLTLQPKEHKCQQQGGAAFWQELGCKISLGQL